MSCARRAWWFSTAMPKTEDELPGSAPATGPAPHVSNEAGANAVEPAAQTVMATPANEDVAGIADASSGHLL